MLFSMLHARVGSVSGGGANPAGTGGEVTLYTPQTGDVAEQRHGRYYREDVVLRALAGDTDIVSYIHCMASAGTVSPVETTNGDKPEPDWFDRIVAEHAQLEERAAKLRRFVLTDEYQKLPSAEQALLAVQGQYMAGYIETLGARIVAERWKRHKAESKQTMKAALDAYGLTPDAPPAH